MPAVILPAMIFEAMSNEARYIANQADQRLGARIDSIRINEEPTRYNDSGWIQIAIDFVNGSSASVVWSNYSRGGNKLLWEVSLTYNGTPHYDYPDISGCLDSVEVLEILTTMSKY